MQPSVYKSHALISHFGVKRVFILTYDLNDLRQQHAVCDVRLQVLDQPLVSRLGEVVVGPVRVDLRSRTNTNRAAQF